MKHASNRECWLCKKPFTGSEIDDRTICVVGISGQRYFVHTACQEKIKNFKLYPEEKALMAEILDDDYLEQEKLADTLSISRSELIDNVKEMITRHSTD